MTMTYRMAMIAGLWLSACSGTATPPPQESTRARETDEVASRALVAAREVAPSLEPAPVLSLTTAFDEARGLWVAERFSHAPGEAPVLLDYRYVTLTTSDETPTAPRQTFTPRENLVTQVSSNMHATLGLVPLVRLASHLIYLNVEGDTVHAILIDPAMNHAEWLGARVFPPSSQGRTAGLQSVQRAPDGMTLLLGGHAGPPEETGSGPWFWTLPIEASRSL